jgi:hypothetical protein
MALLPLARALSLETRMLSLSFHAVDVSIDPQTAIPSHYRDQVAVEVGPGAPGSAVDRGTTVIAVDEGRSSVIVRVPAGAPVPLFWTWCSDGTLAIADAYAGLERVRARVNCSHPREFDRVAVLESFLFDAPLGNRTPLEGVRRVRPGEELNFDLITRSERSRWHWLPRLGRLREESDWGTLVDEGADHLRRLMEPLPLDDEESLLLPLTGGYDSRLLALLAARSMPNPVHTYTFRRGWSSETWVAARVARELGLPHRVLDLTPECYREFAREVVLRTGGMITGMHTHGIYCCEVLLDERLRSMPRVFGYYGGPLTGEQTASAELAERTETAVGLLEQFSRSAYTSALEQHRDAIIADIEELRGPYDESDSEPGRFYDFWRMIERQGGLLTHLFAHHRTFHGVPVLEPMINGDALDFFLSLPRELRVDRKLFKAAFDRIDPELFRMASIHDEPSSWLGRIDQMFGLLQEVADRVDPGQEFVLNPFGFEQHGKNLYNHLQGDVAAGMDVASELFGVDRREPTFPVWRTSTVKEYYRLAALGYLADQRSSGTAGRGVPGPVSSNGPDVQESR